METFSERFVLFLITLFWVIIFAFILALPIMWLWNWLITDIFSLREITWVEAFGINLLFGFLFRK